MEQFKGTTIICVKKDNQVAIGGDGQVTLGSTVIKSNAKKIRKLYNDKVAVGFAGATADAFTLFEKLEDKLNEYAGNLTRAAVELAKEWRTDKILRRLEAMLIAADKDSIYLISGNGDVLSPDEDVCAIGSGGNYALSAAKAMIRFTSLNAETIAKESLKIASEICIYTNNNITIETLGD
ncbi:ATP-dependent protease subunit HslV [Hippea maritima]|uniref:ATP-dependent protease subunit HslV n=1 Tax=Hippea maritima (strain ATCC 700847 / DSM 10411 / MH2) TaxID=760142 RepID=F2LU29_HIPMA|nr:ATP-dependent protease subunit HslV [Hippea maritima]AEA33428.1 ATP-dependent protease hslV [Hippea maritima DSM 10411]